MDDRSTRHAGRVEAVTTLSAAELRALRAALLEAGEEVYGVLRSRIIAGGRSNVTLRLEDEAGRLWALRRPPARARVDSAHDVGREFRVTRALGATSVPVARAVVADDSGESLGYPYSIWEFVPGVVVRSREDVAGWQPAQFRLCADGLLDTLADLHRVDPDAVGLGALGRREDYAARQLYRWSRQWRTMGLEDPRADRLAAELHRRIPPQRATCLVHGDYRVDNVLLDADDVGRVRAVVDWELATLGDPDADLGVMCAYRHQALDLVLGFPAAWTSASFPGPDELRHGYEERQATRVGSFQFHLALGYYKLAVIAAGIAYRHRLGATSGDGYLRAGEAVPVLLESGLEEVYRHE